MAEERLQKILSRAGISSRRTAEALILEGRVQVNGHVVQELGTKADPNKDVIRVDNAVIAEPEALVYYVMYKPERVVTTLDDPEGRDSVGDLIRRTKAKVYPVGRLDYDAEGTLLLTNDGDLAHKLTHPRWGVRRIYLAKVKGVPSEAALAQLREGVRLEDGLAVALEATFERQTPRNTWIRLVLAEGRHHLVKRLCEAVGHPVVRLFRSDYAGIGVGGMQPGDIRSLTSQEVQILRRAVATEAPLPAGGRPKRRGSRAPSAVRDPIFGTTRRDGGSSSPRGGAGGSAQAFRGTRPRAATPQRAPSHPAEDGFERAPRGGAPRFGASSRGEPRQGELRPRSSAPGRGGPRDLESRPRTSASGRGGAPRDGELRPRSSAPGRGGPRDLESRLRTSASGRGASRDGELRPRSSAPSRGAPRDLESGARAFSRGESPRPRAGGATRSGPAKPRGGLSRGPRPEGGFDAPGGSFGRGAATPRTGPGFGKPKGGRSAPKGSSARAPAPRAPRGAPGKRPPGGGRGGRGPGSGRRS